MGASHAAGRFLALFKNPQCHRITAQRDILPNPRRKTDIAISISSLSTTLAAITTQ